MWNSHSMVKPLKLYTFWKSFWEQILRLLCNSSFKYCGEFFFSLISKHLQTNPIYTKFINNSIQKGCIEKIPGCWEHLSTVWHALKVAGAQKSNLATIWFHIANASGSITHKFFVFALHRYGISPQCIRLIETCYKEILSKLFSESATSAWHRHEQGVFACCTLSIILSLLASMNIIILKYLCLLSIKIPSSALKASKISEYLLLKNSQDPSF